MEFGVRGSEFEFWVSGYRILVFGWGLRFGVWVWDSGFEFFRVRFSSLYFWFLVAGPTPVQWGVSVRGFGFRGSRWYHNALLGLAREEEEPGSGCRAQGLGLLAVAGSGPAGEIDG